MNVMTLDEREFAIRLGLSALYHWADLSPEDQEKLFETAVDTNKQARIDLAIFLHEHHPRTMYPAKP